MSETTPATTVSEPGATSQEAPEVGQKSGHQVSIEQLLKAGTHFGHLTSRWNPKMKKYIFMQRNNIHIIDLMQTQAMLNTAAEAASRFARMGRPLLFVGTKKQARETVRNYAVSCDSPYVVERWLGGTLTNFQTIRGSIRRMDELARFEEGESFQTLKKKERLMHTREHEKLVKVLSGIATMPRLPGAVFVVDINREHIAVKEARKLGIPIIAMIDTNCDPDLVDYPIPANDDALKSIQLVTSVIANAVNEGKRTKETRESHEDNKRKS
jgi:small subunit ribosomal protein S2